MCAYVYVHVLNTYTHLLIEKVDNSLMHASTVTNGTMLYLYNMEEYRYNAYMKWQSILCAYMTNVSNV